MPPSFPEDPELDANDDEADDDPEDLVVAAAVALTTEEDEDQDLVLPVEEPPSDATAWDAVHDLGDPDLEEPSTLAAALVDDPWAPVDDASAGDLSFDPSGTGEAPEDPWGALDTATPPDLPSPSSLPVLQSPANSPVLLPLSHLVRSVPAPRSIPWRLPAEILEPVAGRVVVIASPRLRGSRLLVSDWGWADEQQELVRFRLADDGGDTVTRVENPGKPVIALRLHIAGIDIAAEVTLMIDRAERGLLLGRDVLAGRFLVDAGREDWP